MSTRAQNAEQDLIDREASAWLIRIEEQGLDQAEEGDFRSWLAIDPRHRATYDAMRETWRDVAEVPGLADLAKIPSHIAHQGRIPSSHMRPAWRWAGVTAVAASLAGVFMLISPGSSTDRQYRTELAEMRIVTLPDGSSVTLGGRSSITVAYNAAERRVILSSGEALFDVVHDAQRPFLVEAGVSLVRDLGTKFDVNRTAGSVRVGVIEGHVQVSRTDGIKAPPVTIGGGEGVQIIKNLTTDEAGTASSPNGAILVSSRQTPGAWREGRFVFDDVRLADLSADVNRYYGPGVTLGSTAVGDLRVTAAFKVSEIPAFMSALDATLPVRAERLPGGRFRIVDARR